MQSIENVKTLNTASVPKSSEITPENVAAYFLMRAASDGDLITPLKMQKIVYYAYVWNLTINHKKLFKEEFQAWCNGPVLPSLYRQLKEYGASPIPIEFANVTSETVRDELSHMFSHEVREVLDDVYETYMPLTAFELVNLTHNELPWKNAREGIAPTERCDKCLSDDDIFKQYIPVENGT